MQKPTVLTSPFGDEEDDTAPPATPEGQPQARRRQSGRGTLIVPATWEAPADPLRVLFPSQTVAAVLLHDITSDIPGEIRLLVVEDIQDKFSQGQVLIPQYSYIIGQQAGTPKFGQRRLDMTIRTLEFPDGTMVAFDKGSIADATGNAGLSGKVNNHYLQLGISAVLTAALSLSSRAVVNDRGTFRPTLQEEFAQDISQSINQTGQQIVKRELDRPPTITLEKGTPVMIQVKDAVSFQTPRRKVVQ
jgi:type IV secretion system protein VirB10